jgi:hypothetical protein
MMTILLLLVCVILAPFALRALFAMKWVVLLGIAGFIVFLAWADYSMNKNTPADMRTPSLFEKLAK